MNIEQNQKIKNNAISAYLLFLISIIFIFVKKNPDLNNDFVKKHAKSAFLIHLLIILNIFLMKFYWILGNFSVLSFSLNFIISTIIFLILFLMLILWMYKAYKWEFFTIWEIFKWSSNKNLLDINKDWNFWEKDKLTFILSFIPFIWQILTSKYSQNNLIKEILKLNTFVTFIIWIFYVSNLGNLVQILILIYFIFIAFIWVNLFWKWELITVNLPSYFSFSEIWKNFKIFCIYLKKYISWKFVEFKILKNDFEAKEKVKEIEDYNFLKNLEDLKWPKKAIYIPFFNFIYLFFPKNKYLIHMRNWIIISFILLFLIILIFLKFISYKYLFFILFPLSFGIWNIWKIYYKIPFIYDIFIFSEKFLNFSKNTKKIISEKRKEVKEETLKVIKKDENIQQKDEKNQN